MSDERRSYVCNNDEDDEIRNKISLLNDQLRQTMSGGQIMITHGIISLGPSVVASVMNAICQFDEFSPSNDPHGEHDFGCLNSGEHRVFWKIDYYDKQLEMGSPDPSDPSVTTRVITVMLAQEY